MRNLSGVNTLAIPKETADETVVSPDRMTSESRLYLGMGCFKYRAQLISNVCISGHEDNSRFTRGQVRVFWVVSGDKNPVE